MVGTRIKIVWEEQLVDPPNEYIKEERHNKDDHIDRTVLEAIGTTPLYVHITFRGPGGGGGGKYARFWYLKYSTDIAKSRNT